MKTQGLVWGLFLLELSLGAQNYDYDRGLTAQEWIQRDLKAWEAHTMRDLKGPIKEVWMVTQSLEKKSARPTTFAAGWDKQGRLEFEQGLDATLDMTWGKNTLEIKQKNLTNPELNGSVKVEFFPDGRPKSSESYNSFGDLVEKASWSYDAKNRLTGYDVMDNLDNLLEVHNYLWAPEGYLKNLEVMNDRLESQSYGFQAQGFCIYAKTDTETTNWTYDANGVLKEIQKTVSKDFKPKTIKYQLFYGAKGWIQKIEVRDSQGLETRSYSQDSQGRIIQRTISKAPQVFTTKYSYDAQGRLIAEEGDYYRTLTQWDAQGNWIHQSTDTRPQREKPWEPLKKVERQLDYFE